GILEIEREAALVRALGQVAGPHEAPVLGAVAARLPGDVALAGFLDLDRLRSEHGELVRAEGARQHVSEVQDPNALEGARGVSGHARVLRDSSVASRALPDGPTG